MTFECPNGGAIFASISYYIIRILFIFSIFIWFLPEMGLLTAKSRLTVKAFPLSIAIAGCFLDFFVGVAGVAVIAALLLAPRSCLWISLGRLFSPPISLLLCVFLSIFPAIPATAVRTPLSLQSLIYEYVSAAVERSRGWGWGWGWGETWLKLWTLRVKNGTKTFFSFCFLGKGNAPQ